MSGAAPLGGDLMVQMASLFPNASIGQGYGKSFLKVYSNGLLIHLAGLTETSTTVSSIKAGVRMGTVGSAGELIPGIVARVVKPDGSLAIEGERGELVVTGPSMAMGYYKNPAALVKSLSAAILIS